MLLLDNCTRISSNYETILKFIYFDGKLHHDALNIKFYHKHDILDVYNMIFDLTNFLNDYDVKLRERIYYIERDYNQVQKCPFCKVNKLKFRSNVVHFTKTCGSVKCMADSSKMTYTQPKKEKVVSICEGCGCSFSRAESNKKRYCTHGCYMKYRLYSHSEEIKCRISQSNKKVHNSEEYKKIRERIYTPEFKKSISIRMKKSILEGKFTPCITNTWTHWDAKVKLKDGAIKKFRSSWEACFWLANQHLEYEKVRIPYSIDGTWKNYIVDFVDTEKGILYEIKPKSQMNTDKNILKFESAIRWCEENKYIYSIIDESWFIENVKNINFANNESILEKMEQFIVK